MTQCLMCAACEPVANPDGQPGWWTRTNLGGGPAYVGPFCTKFCSDEFGALSTARQIELFAGVTPGAAGALALLCARARETAVAGSLTFDHASPVECPQMETQYGCRAVAVLRPVWTVGAVRTWFWTQLPPEIRGEAQS